MKLLNVLYFFPERFLFLTLNLRKKILTRSGQSDPRALVCRNAGIKMQTRPATVGTYRVSGHNNKSIEVGQQDHDWIQEKDISVIGTPRNESQTEYSFQKKTTLMRINVQFV